MNTENKPMLGLRLPLLDSAAAIAAAPNLTAEEKEMAIGNLNRCPPNDAWYLLNHEPKLVAVMQIWGTCFMELLDDAPGIPGKPGQWMAFEAARFMNCEFMAAILSTSAVNTGEVCGNHNAQLGILDFPDSKLWTDQQRLAIKFARAVLEGSVSDDLYAEAVEAWGEKKIMSYILMLGWDMIWAMLANTFNLTSLHGAAGQGGVTPKEGAAFRAWWPKNLNHMLEFWRAEQPFGDVDRSVPVRMKAAVVSEFGGPEAVEFVERTKPQAANDEIIIKVAATAFNPADTKIRSGELQPMLNHVLPITLGAEVSGVVDSVGWAVAGLEPGDKVYAYCNIFRDGAAADYVACKAADVARAPTSISLVDAAALPVAGCTAWQGLFTHAKIQPGQRVMIVGAAGGVGTVAVQLAKWKGAHVIAVAAGQRESLMREIGADEMIDYTKGSIADALKEPVDAIFHIAPSDPNEFLGLLKPNGILVCGATPPNPALAASKKVRAMFMASLRSADQLTRLAMLVDEGKVRPVVTERVRLSQIVDVHRRAGKTHGKVLLVVDDKLAG